MDAKVVVFLASETKSERTLPGSLTTPSRREMSVSATVAKYCCGTLIALESGWSSDPGQPPRQISRTASW